MNLFTWAKRHNACSGSLVYLKEKELTWATWVQSCGEWRAWACEVIGVAWCSDDIFTGRDHLTGAPLRDAVESTWRRHLNQPHIYASLREHFESVVLPAFRKAGVR